MNNEDAKSFTSFISAFLVLLIGRLFCSSFIFALKPVVDHFYFLFSNDDTMAKGKVSSSSGGSTAESKRVTESER